MSSLLDAGAFELAAMIRRREASPIDVVDAHIARIEAVNPVLNAVVADRFGRAREEARLAQERVAATRDADTLPPLWGVPCTIKEFIPVEGMPNTAGVVAWRGRIAERDAPVVARLRRAGAIVLGVTNVPEGGLWYETVNRIYGRTNNPWDRRRTPGGSSGGEAAIIAAGGSPFGIGSDVGGSVRTPSAWCGTVAHKPTGRMVPNSDHFPAAAGDVSAYLTCGPMGRRVADLLPLLRLIAGPDAGDALCRPWELNRPVPPLSEVVVYPLEHQGRDVVAPSMRDGLRRATAALAARGARFGRIEPRKFQRAFEIWGAMMSAAEGPSYKEILGGGTPIRPWRELGRFPLGGSPHTFAALALCALEGLVPQMAERAAARVAEGRALQAELEALLGDNGVILHPPYSRPAPLHGAALLTPFHFTFTGIFNVLEFPVTQVPVGFDDGGLPVGLQVAAARGRDPLALSVAAAIEDELGGWVRAHPV